jgi:hypothetical protein
MRMSMRGRLVLSARNMRRNACTGRQFIVVVVGLDFDCAQFSRVHDSLQRRACDRRFWLDIALEGTVMQSAVVVKGSSV